MSGLDQRVYRLIAEMVGLPPGVGFNPIAALESIAKKVVMLHGAQQAMKADRIAMRQALTGLAFDFGLQSGRLDDLVLLQWPLDPSEPVTIEEFEEQLKEKLKPRVTAPQKGVVSLH